MTARGNPTMQIHVAWEQAMRLNQPVTLLCSFCDFTATGCLYHARREHQAHRQLEHPHAVSTRRANRHPNPPMVSRKTLDQNIANARETGAATWEGATT